MFRKRHRNDVSVGFLTKEVSARSVTSCSSSNFSDTDAPQKTTVTMRTKGMRGADFIDSVTGEVLLSGIAGNISGTKAVLEGRVDGRRATVVLKLKKSLHEDTVSIYKTEPTYSDQRPDKTKISKHDLRPLYLSARVVRPNTCSPTMSKAYFSVLVGCDKSQPNSYTWKHLYTGIKLQSASLKVLIQDLTGNVLCKGSQRGYFDSQPSFELAPGFDFVNFVGILSCLLSIDRVGSLMGLSAI